MERDALPPPITLVVKAGPPRGNVGPLIARDWRLGRAAENDVALVDIAVSRQHALLAARDGRWFLRDLNSTRGTYVNSRRLEPQRDAQLVAGDQVRIGSWTFEVRLAMRAGDPTPASLSRPQTLGSVPQQRLRALFSLAHTAQHAGDEQELLAAICRDLGASLAYDRVAILRGEIGDVQVCALHTREGIVERSFSSTLLRVAEPEEPAVFESIDASDLSQSLITQPVAHAICLRLAGVSETTWLYLDRAEPFQDRDGSVLAYVEAAARIAALAISHREGLQAAAERERLAAEQSQARRVQMQLCASRQGRCAHVDYAFSTEPGAGMCGDFIDVIEARDGAAWCFVGDVVGHGTAAALLMATALALLRSECRRAQSPAAVADHLAAELAPVLAPGQFLTLWLARVERDGTASVVDAGHGQCWIARADGSVTAAVLEGHPPIGVVAGTRHRAEPLPLARGDRWIVATDGYSEALGEPAVRQACLELLARPQPPADLLAAFGEAVERGDDDASLLVLEWR
jgi:hypothetical protein